MSSRAKCWVDEDPLGRRGHLGAADRQDAVVVHEPGRRRHLPRRVDAGGLHGYVVADDTDQAVGEQGEDEIGDGTGGHHHEALPPGLGTEAVVDLLIVGERPGSKLQAAGSASNCGPPPERD